MTTKTYAEMTKHGRRVLGAFKLAMRELGAPEHLNGKCPAAGCTCQERAEAIARRAAELLDDHGIEDAQLCHDCRVLVPFLADCYMIDCGNVVCLPCGEKRGCTRTVLADLA